MQPTRTLRHVIGCVALAMLVGLAACGSLPSGKRERACMARAMYFESNRSSDEGMLAVGTVVMNRVESDKFPDTVCAVVGQKNQFAPGVLSKPMNEARSRERAGRMAALVLSGKRHRGVGGKAMFFHTAGHSFPYRNMHYVVVAGGNSFYEKRTATAFRPNRPQSVVAQAARRSRPQRSEPLVQVAAAAPPPPIVRRAAVLAPIAAPVAVAAPPPMFLPDPLLAAAQPAPSPASIEDLIMLNGGG